MGRKSNRKKGSAKRRSSGPIIRRLIGLLFMFAALAVGARAYLAQPRFSMFIWAAAAGCLLIEGILFMPRRRLPVLIYILMTVLCASLIVTAPTYDKYVPLFEKDDYTSVDITQLRLESAPPENFALLNNLQKLDLRGSNITDFNVFKNCTTLKSIDVRDNHAFTQAEYDSLSAALPGCSIVWSMPVAGRYYDSDTTYIDLSDRSFTPQEIAQIMRDNPQISFDYAVDVLGSRFPKDAVELNLQGASYIDADELYNALRLLPDVTKIDLRGTPASAETVSKLQDQHPQIEFLFTFDAPGAALDTLTESYTLTGTAEDFYGCEPFFEYMPNLKRIDLRAAPFSEEEISRITAAYPNAEVLFTFYMFGVQATNQDTKVVLDNIKVGSAAAVEHYLQYLPHVEQIDMCNCGLSNEEMAALRERHPEIKFVWMIHFAVWNLRTDIEVFSTLWDCSWSYSSATFAPLQYCTDLLFLDLGHDHVSNIEAIAKLKKLKLLILACNTITDISPLAGLEDLEYVELFSNQITDFSPLANKTKLIDLNINRNRIKSIEPLLTLTSLERLWIGACGLSNNELRRLKEALPNCNINISAGNNPTSAGWRENSHYFTIKKMYETGKYIPWST